MKQFILLGLISLLVAGCYPAYDDRPQAHVIIDGYQQSSYTHQGYVDTYGVFNEVTATDSAGILVGNIYFPIVTQVEFGEIDLRYTIRNTGYTPIEEYEIVFAILLENGEYIYVEDWGTCVHDEVYEQLYIDTEAHRAVEIIVSNYSLD